MRLLDLDGRGVVIWGRGVEGMAALDVLPRLIRPASLRAVDDTDADLAAAVAEADVVVKSPGVSRYRDEVQALARTGRLTSGTDLFLSETGGTDVIAVTGSKGKST